MVKMSWEWIAGFFEGEGNIFWQEGKKGTKQGLHGRATLGQKDKQALQVIYDFLILDGFSPPSFYLRPAANSISRLGKASEIWILMISRRDDVIKFYESITPFLFEKREKAEFVLMRLSEEREHRNSLLKKAFELKNSGLSWREISERMGVGRTAILNYLKSANIKFAINSNAVDNMSWRNYRVMKGLCESCGKDRGGDGTKRKCRKCADHYNNLRRILRGKHAKTHASLP